MARTLSSAAGAAMLIAVLTSGLVYGQAYDRVAPQVPKAPPSPSVQVPPASPPVSQMHEVLLKVLRGIVFVPSAAALRKEGLAADEEQPVRAPGNSLLTTPAFIARVRPFIGRSLTREGLDRITHLADEWYRQHGRPFVGIAVPPQNISSGVVQIVVEDYRVGQIRPQGNRYFSDPLLRRESGLRAGQTLTFDGVKDSLARLNDNPFRSVTMRFQPGAAPGTTDIALETSDRFPLRVYAGFDDQGIPTLGRSEWSVGANWGNLLGEDQQLSYQYTRGVTGLFNAHALSWTAPLSGGDKLLIFGSYEKARPDVGPDFGETGESGQASLRFLQALPRVSWSNGLELTQELQAGYDFKTTNNDLEFGGVQVFGSRIEVDQFPLSYDGTLSDPFGQTALDNRLIYSPGGLTGANDSASFESSLPGSSASYLYDRVVLTRVTFLPRSFSWVARIIGQWSNGNLPYSEQLGAGGLDSVRGYATDTALASEGLLVTQELRGPAFSLIRALHIDAPVSDQMQLGVFWDYGHVHQPEPVAYQTNDADLSSTGVNLHATLGRYVDLRVDTGWQLRRAPGAEGRAALADIALTIGF